MPDLNVATTDSNLRQNLQSSWAAARDASTAGVIDSTATSYGTAIQERRTGSDYSVRRYFFAVDTSGVSIKPERATVKIRGITNTDSNVILVKIDQSATGDASTNFAASDFGKIDFTTPFSNEYSAAWNTSGYNIISLNDAALNEMVDFDVIKIALIGYDFDFLNVEPADGINRKTGLYPASAIVADNRPLISYTLPTPGRSFAKDYTINTYNKDVLSVQYGKSSSVEQVPFFLGVPGPARLRGRENAPIVSTGKKKN
jgi:hypothetical protein